MLLLRDGGLAAVGCSEAICSAGRLRPARRALVRPLDEPHSFDSDDTRSIEISTRHSEGTRGRKSLSNHQSSAQSCVVSEPINLASRRKLRKGGGTRRSPDRASAFGAALRPGGFAPERLCARAALHHPHRRFELGARRTLRTLYPRAAHRPALPLRGMFFGKPP